MKLTISQPHARQDSLYEMFLEHFSVKEWTLTAQQGVSSNATRSVL